MYYGVLTSDAAIFVDEHQPLVRCTAILSERPDLGHGYPLNLSILLSGGKETNKDSLSNGE
jgi:hypothetical protein